MSPKNIRILKAILALVILSIAVLASQKSVIPPTGDAAIWLNCGLLTLVFGAFIFEHRFTKPDDVIVNGLLVYVAVASLSDNASSIYWNVLKWGALALSCAAIFISFDTRRNNVSETGWKRVAFRLVTEIGKAKVIFSVVFILALTSFFTDQPNISLPLIFCWGLLMLLANLDLRWLGTAFAPGVSSDGYVTALKAPRFVCFKTHENDEFTGVVEIGCSTADARFTAQVLRRNLTPEGAEYFAVLVDDTIDSLIPGQAYEVFRKLETKSAGAVEDAPIGYAIEGSSISGVRIRMLPNRVAAIGQLVSALTSDGNRIFFQVVDAKHSAESIESENANTFTVATATQVGFWEPENNGFVSSDWILPENAPLHSFAASHLPVLSEKDGFQSVGTLPDADAPVFLSIKDLVLHHTAILGVTGTGKSFLAFDLIEKCAAAGIKVICLDPTGDYKRHLMSAQLLAEGEHLVDFLKSNVGIGIIEPTQKTTSFVELCKKVSEAALKFARDTRSDDDVMNPEPRILVAIEEAHLFIPEWNFASKKDQEFVNGTAQVILQARKYGLGFLIITQRTANVVKSALNQCNTMFAFRAFDETGFEFLKNYMGSERAKLLPYLGVREAVIVGKASASSQPLVAKFRDQERKLKSDFVTFAPDAVVAVEGYVTTEVSSEADDLEIRTSDVVEA